MTRPAAPGAAELRGATFSECGTYRYRLWRLAPGGGRRAVWVMLNPSRADAEEDDPTIRRVRTFTASAGCDGGFEVVNLCAFRATFPVDLRAAAEAGADVVGPDCDEAILEAVRGAALVVCAWGDNARHHRARRDAVLALLRGAGVALHCLRLTASGEPVHPVREAADLTPVPWDQAGPSPAPRAPAAPRAPRARPAPADPGPAPLAPAAADPDIRAAERRALGYCLTTHPLAGVGDCDLAAVGAAPLVSAAEALDRGGGRATLAACVVRVLERRTRAGDWMAVLWLEDDRCRREAVCFPRDWCEVADLVEDAARPGVQAPLLLDARGDGGDKLVVCGARPLHPAPAPPDDGPPLGDFVVVDVETCVGPEGSSDVPVIVLEQRSRGGDLVRGSDGDSGAGDAGPRVPGAPPPDDGSPDGDRVAAGRAGEKDAAPAVDPRLARLRVVEVGVALYRALPMDGRARHLAGPPSPTHCLAARHAALCDPGCPVDAESLAVHGIGDDQLRGQPTFAQRAAKLALVLGADPAALGLDAWAGSAAREPAGGGRPRTLVTLNGRAFDVPVLAAEFARAGLPPAAWPPGVRDPALGVDAYDFVRHRYRGRRARPASKKLADQCAFFGVVLDRAHRADADAAATGELLLALRAAGFAPRSLARLRGGA